MDNLINGRKPVFGDPEQIAWLKRHARLQEAAKRGYVTAEVEENPLGIKRHKDQVIVVRFTCPGCLERHRFSLPLMDQASDYTAECGVEFQYSTADNQLQLLTPSGESNGKDN